MINKPKIIVVQGATSTGKSDFAVEVALRLRSGQAHKFEIISADSRQVYKGMDIGTGKITKKEMRGVHHHLLDVVSPKTDFNVSKYKKLADKKIKEILKRGNIPIICGGTGFYIDAIVSGLVLPEVPPNKSLRKKLEKRSTDELLKMLEKLDRARAKKIDKQNRVRLIRAIEIATALGKVPLPRTVLGKYDVLRITLDLPDDILKEKIHARILKRIKIGMMKEFEKLHSPKQGFGLGFKKMEAFGLEYKYGALYLKGEIDKKEFIEKLAQDTWHYAKRQRTWFKRNLGTLLDPSDKNAKQKVLKEIKSFIEN